jgi:hypothetical protein
MSRSFVGNIIERRRAYNYRMKNIYMYMRKYELKIVFTRILQRA